MNPKRIADRFAFWKRAGLIIVLGGSMISRADTAQDTYIRAHALEQSRSYEAELADGSGKIYQRANKDGTVYHRIDFKKPATQSVIKNASGSFTLYPATKHAVREADNDKEEPDFEQYATYAMSEGEYEKIPCYIVTRNIPVNDKTLKIFRDWFPGATPNQSLGELRKIFKNNFATREVFWIGKEDSVIYANMTYNSSGKFLGERKYAEVNLDPSLPDSLFEIPTDYTLKRAVDGQDFAQLTGEIITQGIQEERNKQIAAQQPGFWSTLPQTLNRIWEWFFAYGSWFFLMIGVVTITVIALLKWQEKKKR